MGDGSSRSIVKALKNEWSLFWEAIQGDESSQPEFPKAQLEIMSLDQARELARSLSDGRKKINQRLESLNKEIDLNSAKLETLRLVGALEDETLKRIHELNDIGQTMAEAMLKLDQRLRLLRDQEISLREKNLEEATS